MAKIKPSPKTSTDERAESVYKALHEQIKDLANPPALEVIVQVRDHLNSMIEGLEEEIREAEEAQD